MKMKPQKTISTCMALLLLMLSFSVPTAAETNPTLTIDSVSLVKPGESTTVALHLSDLPGGIYVLQLAVKYDPDKLQLISASAGDIFSTVGSATINGDTAGTIYLVWDSIDKQITDDCTLLTMSFSAKPTETCDTFVSISETEECILANWETEFNPSLLNGIIHIEPDTVDITYSQILNGTVSGVFSAMIGETVTLTVTPANGYTLETLTATYVDDQSGTQQLVLTQDANDATKYTFIMPPYDVTVSAAFNMVVIPVTGITVAPATASLTVGQTQQLTASVEPANATNPAVTWTSDNATVATVDENGLVTAVAAGTATIYATSAADSNIQAACAVTVTAAQPQYDAWISGIDGWLGSGYRVRYIVRVRNTIENPTFEVRMGEDGENRQVDNLTDFKCSDWACWMFDGDPKPIAGKDYTEYYILVKFFVRHLNVPALISVKDGSGNAVRIRSFQSSANGIMGVIGDYAGHSMVDFLDIKYKMNDNDADYGELRDEMVIYHQKALKIDK